MELWEVEVAEMERGEARCEAAHAPIGCAVGLLAPVGCFDSRTIFDVDQKVTVKFGCIFPMM